MTELNERTVEELETRQAEIAAENQEEMTTETIEERANELEAIQNELETRKQAEETRKAELEAVANGAGTTKEENMEEKTMTLEELRSSKEYIDAYVGYLKTNDEKEVRSLLTTNATAATGYVPVPTLVDDIVRHAWENENIISRVRKTGFKGNVKVAFELSADGAYIHSEGSSAPTEEALTLGIVELKAENIKKWITISDEMMEETGEGFLRYVFEELSYQIIKKLSYDIVDDIASATYTTNQSNAVGIPKVKKNPAILTIAEAAANLSDEAANVCVIMNPLTKVEFQKAYAAGNFAVDPFQGLPVLFSGKLPAFTAANENDTYAIVGDLSAVQLNFPAGDGVKLIQDPYSLAEKDLVKIVGRVFCAHDVVAPGRLVRLTKEAAAVTT